VLKSPAPALFTHVIGRTVVNRDVNENSTPIARQRLFAPFTIEQHSIMSGRLRPVGNKKMPYPMFFRDNLTCPSHFIFINVHVPTRFTASNKYK